MNRISNEKKNEIKEEKKKDFGLWNIKKPLSTEKIIPIINNSKTLINQNINKLLEEKEKEHKEKLYYNKSKTLKRTNSIESYNEQFSKNKYNLLNKIEKNIHYIQDTTNKIINLNDLYMNHTSRDSIKIEYLNNENNDEKNITNYSFFSKKHNDKKFKNFEYITNNNRRQLKNALMKFNPYFHLENLHILEKSVPFIQKDISILKKEIEEDIKEITDIHKFQKKYEKIKKKNYKSKSSENIQMKNSSPKNHVKHIKKNLNYFNKIKHNSKEISLYKDEKLEEINKILNCTDSIKNIIDNNNINKNIEKYVNDYNKYKDYNANKFNFHNNEYFFEKNKEIIDNFKDLYSFKLNKIIQENEKRTLNNINRENEYFSNKVLGIKNSFLNEFNSYLEKNRINLHSDSLGKDNIN